MNTEDQLLQHEVFSRFPRWEGEIPDGYCMNFLGIKTKIAYFTPLRRFLVERPDWRGDYPPVQDEEYFEWIDLLEAVTKAKKHFTMIELGAGWGRWICNAVAAIRRTSDLPYTLI